MKHTPITADRNATIAQALTQGDYSLLPEGDYSFLSDEAWADEAQIALDGDYYDDLLELIAEGQQREKFASWQYRGQFVSDREGERREFTDFGDWASRNAVPPVSGGVA